MPRDQQCKMFAWADTPAPGSSSSAAAQRGFVIKKAPKVKLSVCSPTHFKVFCSGGDAQVQQALVSVSAMSMSDTEHLVMLDQYATFLEHLKKARCEVGEIPKEVLAALQKAAQVEESMPFQQAMEKVEKKLPEAMWTSMYGFQRQAVAFAVQRRGKILCADEMGLGKTIVAIGIAAYYKKLPLLIIAPSSVKANWKKELAKWTEWGDDKVQIIATGKDKVQDVPVSIISYDLAEKMSDVLKANHYKTVVCDESHYLKNPKAKRTKSLLPILQAAKHAILLSGTPALSRPNELFPQLKSLGCSIFTSFNKFGVRYCAGQLRPFGWDYSGSSNLEELNLILTSLCMIRRTKTETLKDLPVKTRRTVSIPGVAQNNEQREVLGALESEIGRTGGISADGKLKLSKAGRDKMFQLYSDTATLKVEPVLRYVAKLVEKGEKFLIFAHHQVMMEALDNWAETQGVGFIRIDGGTASKNRSVLVKRFQTKTSCKIAILSMTAAGQGLTLTAASKVVFSELHWNPGTLLQCEDRVHRIGQKENVDIVFLIGKDSFDEVLWKMISKKLTVLKGAIGGHDDATSDFAKPSSGLKYVPLDQYFSSKQAKRVKVEEEEEDDDDILAPVFSSPPPKRKEEEKEEESEEELLTPVAAAAPPPAKKARSVTPKKRVCTYGEKCYRKNPRHFEEFAHPWLNK